MNVFFDNDTSPVLAETIDGFLRHQNARAFHIRDVAAAGLPIGRDAPDTAWIPALGRDPRTWIVVPGDKRIARVAAEREAFRRAGLKGLLLQAGYRKLAVHQQASRSVPGSRPMVFAINATRRRLACPGSSITPHAGGWRVPDRQLRHTPEVGVSRSSMTSSSGGWRVPDRQFLVGRVDACAAASSRATSSR